MQKTVSIRMDENVYAFANKMAKQEKKEVSQTMRDLIGLGRLMLAINRYMSKKISLGKASEVANISISEMIELLAQFGIKADLEKEDYLESLENLRKVW
ncbi:MAG: UPF0175 family protein [Candidatus Micrarchaeota archaeon]